MTDPETRPMPRFRVQAAQRTGGPLENMVVTANDAEEAATQLQARGFITGPIDRVEDERPSKTNPPGVVQPERNRRTGWNTGVAVTACLVVLGIVIAAVKDTNGLRAGQRRERAEMANTLAQDLARSQEDDRRQGATKAEHRAARANLEWQLQTARESVSNLAKTIAFTQTREDLAVFALSNSRATLGLAPDDFTKKLAHVQYDSQIAQDELNVQRIRDDLAEYRRKKQESEAEVKELERQLGQMGD